jgi:uncharacterized C2H2 Zn-finger protein
VGNGIKRKYERLRCRHVFKAGGWFKVGERTRWACMKCGKVFSIKQFFIEILNYGHVT